MYRIMTQYVGDDAEDIGVDAQPEVFETMDDEEDALEFADDLRENLTDEGFSVWVESDEPEQETE